MSQLARRAAEDAARESYGRLLAILGARTRDIAAAEDALAEAFRTALEVWAARGVPDRPEAWLLTAARRRLGHDARHLKVRDATAGALRLLGEEAAMRTFPAFDDERLKLLFVCAHPAIDPAVRTPLMLQTVIGLDTPRIAAAFAASPAAMAQRLVRAKAKIRDAGIPFAEPELDVLPERMEAVLACVYAAYGAGWDEGLGTGLAHEALFLARLLVRLTPDQAEARGLLAMILYCEARRPARRSRDGTYVPLADQDTTLWSRDMIVEAESHLMAAARLGAAGRYQTEAAIQSVHAQRAATGVTEYRALAILYDVLLAQAPVLGVEIGRAVVRAELDGPEAGLTLLDSVDPARVVSHQPYWAARAHLLERAERRAEAMAARNRAIGLTDDPAVRAYLARPRL